MRLTLTIDTNQLCPSTDHRAALDAFLRGDIDGTTADTRLRPFGLIGYLVGAFKAGLRGAPGATLTIEPPRSTRPTLVDDLRDALTPKGAPDAD